MTDDQLMDQNEIEQLLNQASADAKGEEPAKPPAAETAPEPLGQSEIESLLRDTAAGGEASSEQATGAGEAPPSPDDDDDKLLGQDDIEKLLTQAGKAPAKPPPEQTPPKEAPKPRAAGEGAMPQQDVEYLLNQAEQALQSIDSPGADELPHGVASFRLEEFTGAEASAENATLDLIRDVELDLKIELGRTHMYLEDVLKLRKGAVVPLDKLAGDPVDIFVNGRLIARGEVLVLNDNFCVRVAELLTGTNVFT